MPKQKPNAQQTKNPPQDEKAPVAAGGSSDNQKPAAKDQANESKADATTTTAEVNPFTITGPITMVALETLKPHPLSVKLYGKGCSTELLESIRKHGILQPLLVARDTTEIIAGNSRADAARQLNIKEVPVTYFESKETVEIEAAVVESNSQRVKTHEQVGREFIELKRIEKKLGKLRMGKKDENGEPVKMFSPEEIGKAGDRAAEKLAISRPTGEKAAKVIEVLEVLKKEGKQDAVNALRQLLERSYDAAAKATKDGKYTPPPPKQKKETKTPPAQSDEDTTKTEKRSPYDLALDAAFELEVFIGNNPEPAKKLSKTQCNQLKKPLDRVAAWVSKL